MYTNQSNIKPKMYINQGMFGRIMYKNQGKAALLLVFTPESIGQYFTTSRCVMPCLMR